MATKKQIADAKKKLSKSVAIVNAAKKRAAYAKRNTVPPSPSQGLTGEQKNAATFVTNLFKEYGLSTLAPKIIQYIREGYSSDTVAIMLQETPEFKERFKANEERRKAGLSVLSPAEYISTERSYRQLMQEAGLPVGFYDTNEDFQSFIAKDVSPTEVKSRIDAAKTWYNTLTPDTKRTYLDWYEGGVKKFTEADIVASALDVDRATAIVQQRFNAARIASATGVSRGLAEQAGAIAGNDITSSLVTAAQESETVEKLSSIYGGDATASDVVREAFLGDTGSASKRRRLASQERAAFSGSSGLAQGSLKSDKGQI